MADSTTRKEFEAWYLDYYPGHGIDRRNDGSYVGTHAECSFEAWQASRKALLKKQDQEQEEFVSHLADFEPEDTFHG